MTDSLGVLNFGPYEPDNPDLYNPGLEGAVNVIPRQNHFEPLRSPTPVSASVLPTRPLGAYGCYDSAQNSYIFAGVQDGIYQYRSNAWVDVSRVTAYSPEQERWEFAKWGNLCLASCLANDLQYLTLGDNNFQDLVTNIKAHHIAVVRDFVMIGDVNDQDGLTPNRIRWSAFRDPFDWTPSASTQSDFRDLEGQSVSGRVNRIIGGEYALVFMQDAIWRLTYVGPPTIFQADEVDPDVGTIAESSIIQHAGRTYFLAEDGFRITRGGVSESIGHQKINRDILERLDYNHLDRIRVAVYKDNQLIVWAIPGPGNIGGRPNTLVLYNFVHDRWAGGLVEVEELLQGATPYVSFDDPVVDATYGNLDGVPGSADDKVWAGGSTEFMSIDEAFRLMTWTGDALEALFTTSEKQLTPGRRTSVNELRPLVDLGEDIQISIGHRDRQRDPVVWTPEQPENDQGIVPMAVDARFMRLRARVPAGVNFEDTVGIEVFGAPSGG